MFLQKTLMFIIIYFYKILDDGLVWDDSALTITINPMQTDVTSEDSSESENSESEEDEGKVIFSHLYMNTKNLYYFSSSEGWIFSHQSAWMGQH